MEGGDEMSESESRGRDGERREERRGRTRRMEAIARERCRTSRCSDVSLVSLAARLVGRIRANAMCNDAGPSDLANRGVFECLMCLMCLVLRFGAYCTIVLRSVVRCGKSKKKDQSMMERRVMGDPRYEWWISQTYGEYEPSVMASQSWFLGRCL